MSSPFGVRPPIYRGRGGRQPASAGAWGSRESAAGAAQAQVEAPGVLGIEQAELLVRGQGGAVPHLDRPGAEPDRGRRGGGQRQHHSGEVATTTGVEVVLSEPVPGVAEPFGLLGQVDAVQQRLGRVRAGRDRDQV